MEARRRILITAKKKVKNLYNRNAATLNAFWRANSPLGELVTNRDGYRASEFIKVKPNTIYTVNYNNQTTAVAAGIVFWQDNSVSNPISGVALVYQTYYPNLYYYTFTTPTNCQYLTLSEFPGSSDVQLEIGSTPSPYVPY